MRWLFAVLCLSIATLSHANATPALSGKTIDKVLVVKATRQLHLISHGQTLKSYRIFSITPKISWSVCNAIARPKN